MAMQIATRGAPEQPDRGLADRGIAGIAVFVGFVGPASRDPGGRRRDLDPGQLGRQLLTGAQPRAERQVEHVAGGSRSDPHGPPEAAGVAVQVRVLGRVRDPRRR